MRFYANTHSDSWECRSISSRFHPRDPRRNTRAERLHLGSCGRQREKQRVKTRSVTSGVAVTLEMSLHGLSVRKKHPLQQRPIMRFIESPLPPALSIQACPPPGRRLRGFCFLPDGDLRRSQSLSASPLSVYLKTSPKPQEASEQGMGYIRGARRERDWFTVNRVPVTCYAGFPRRRRRR